MKNTVLLCAMCMGPCAYWLAWALVNRRPTHVILAMVANLVLWVGGPAFIIHVARVLT